MSNLHADDAGHWRLRAEHAREQAGNMLDAAAREEMLRIASYYERLARQAQDRTGPRAKRGNPGTEAE